MESKSFKIQTITEDNLNILARITGIFVRRHLQIKSLELVRNTAKEELQITIKLHCEDDQLVKVVNQINKQIDVLAATYTLENKTLLTL